MKLPGHLHLSGLPTLSIRQPWAWLILHAGKDIENRSWRTNFRGEFLIHAAKGCTRSEFEDACYFAKGAVDDQFRGQRIPDPKIINRGGIVGIAEVVDCVNSSGSSWYMGEWGFVLQNVRPLPFIPCKGALGFFDVERVNS